MSHESMNPRQKDGLTEIVNMGVGHACAVLNQMVGSPVSIAVPQISFVTQDSIENDINKISKDVVVVRMVFGGDIKGLSAIILDGKEARALVAAMNDGQISEADIEATMNATLTEVGNIMINSLMGVMANVLTKTLQYQLPIYGRGEFERVIKNLDHLDRNHVLSIVTKISVDTMSVSGRIVILFAVDSMQSVIEKIDELSSGAA